MYLFQAISLDLICSVAHPILVVYRQTAPQVCAFAMLYALYIFYCSPMCPNTNSSFPRKCLAALSAAAPPQGLFAIPASFLIVVVFPRSFRQASIFNSSPQANTTTSVEPLSFATISLTCSALYFLVVTFFTANPLFSLSSSCALIQHFAIRFCAISTPPGKPALTLPPSHQGFWTRSKECRSVVRGRAAEETR